MQSILNQLREAQTSAKSQENVLESAGLTPKEWLQMIKELREEGVELQAWDDALLEYKFQGVYLFDRTKIYVDLQDPWLGAFRSLFVIRERYGKVCSGYELCNPEDCLAKTACPGACDACASSYGAWALADEALQAFANEVSLPES